MGIEILEESVAWARANPSLHSQIDNSACLIGKPYHDHGGGHDPVGWAAANMGITEHEARKLYVNFSTGSAIAYAEGLIAKYKEPAVSVGFEIGDRVEVTRDYDGRNNRVSKGRSGVIVDKVGDLYAYVNFGPDLPWRDIRFGDLKLASDSSEYVVKRADGTEQVVSIAADRLAAVAEGVKLAGGKLVKRETNVVEVEV